MSTLIADTPLMQVLVRDQFFYDNKRGHRTFTPAYMVGFRAEPGKVPTFQVLTEEGAMWARVPIHMLVERPCRWLPLEHLVWWDCYGYDFAVHQFAYLKGHALTAHSRDGQRRPGVYRFTIDWMGGLGEIPDQHKQHHVIALEDGHLAAYPNNRIEWHDESWIRGLPEKPQYEAHTQSYSVEEGRRGKYGRKP